MRKKTQVISALTAGLLIVGSVASSSPPSSSTLGSLFSSARSSSLSTDGAPESVQPPSVDTAGLKSQKRIEMLYTEEEVIACAKLIYGEYGADWVSDYEKAKVVCTLVNRTHSPKWVNYVGSSELMAQLTSPNQFHYIPSFPCTDRHYRIAYDVLWRASQITQGCEGITWETNALSYWGDGNINHFY